MYCPRCESQYRPGITTCSDCGTPLVDSLPSPQAFAAPAIEPEVVFADSKPELIAIARSILMSAGIEHGVRGEGVQDLFGWGRFPSGVNAFIGPVKIVVAPEQAADAKVLLSNVATGQPGSVDVAYEQEDCAAQGFMWRRARTARRLVSTLVLAYFALMFALWAWSEMS